MINRAEWLKALQIVKPGLAGNTTIEQASSFIFTEGNIATYNDDVAVSYPLKGIDFTGAVPGAELLSVLTKAKEMELDVTATDELVIKGTKFKASIRMDSEINLPTDALKPGRMQPAPANLLQAIGMCLFSASKDAGNPILTCIHIYDDVVESCDNFRIARTKLSEPIKTPMLLPLKAAQELLNYEVVKYSVAEGWAHFKTKSGCLFSSRTYEGEYPDITPIMNMGKTHSLKFPEDMDGLLDRASVALSGADMPEVKVLLTKGNVTVKSEGEVVRYEESAKMRVEKPITFAINPDFLRQILANHSEAEIAEDLSRMRFNADGFEHVIALTGE